jgi:hypothetical protein
MTSATTYVMLHRTPFGMHVNSIILQIDHEREGGNHYACR